METNINVLKGNFNLLLSIKYIFSQRRACIGVIEIVFQEFLDIYIRVYTRIVGASSKREIKGRGRGMRSLCKQTDL